MHPIDQNHLLELLAKRRQQTLTPQEQQILEQWFHSLQATDASWFRNKEEEAEQLNLLWQSIEEKTAPVQILRKKRSAPYWWAAAAVLTGLILLLVLSPRTNQPVTASSEEQKPTLPAMQRIITAALGTVKTVILPDSSTVLLNSGASLIYPESFNGKDRTVVLLKGQAFFDIKKNTQPFIVHSEGLQTQVLGTSFEINIKPAKQIAVALATGKVKVSSIANAESAYLLPGKQLIYSLKSKTMTVTDCTLASIAQWRTGQIKLERASFSALADAFQTVYGVQLKAGNHQVNQQTYTITLKYSTRMEDMLQVLSAIHSNNYSIHDKTATLNPQ